MNSNRGHQPLVDFQGDGGALLDRLKQTGEPLVLTVDGKAELVVQDAASYQKLLDLAEEAEVVEGIRRGLEDLNAGRTISLEDFKGHVRKKLGLSV